MNLKPFVLMSVTILFFTSCDPEVHFHREVQNNSDYTILLIHQYDGGVDTTEIAPMQTIEFLNDFRRGRRKEYNSCESDNLHPSNVFSFMVKNDSTKEVNANPTGSENWEFTTTNKTMNGGGDCHCSLVITNDMIQ